MTGKNEIGGKGSEQMWGNIAEGAEGYFGGNEAIGW